MTGNLYTENIFNEFNYQLQFVFEYLIFECNYLHIGFHVKNNFSFYNSLYFSYNFELLTGM